MKVYLNSKWLLIATLSYIYIPIIIFMLGFTKLWIALVTLVFVGVFLACLYKDYFEILKKQEDISINIFVLIGTILVISFICILLGFGGIYEQSQDWWKHNAIINDLTDYSWPVYYHYPDKSLLTYYLGQYLVPCLIGKIFVSKEVSQYMMGIWGIVGCVIVYLNLIRVTKSSSTISQLRTLLIMFFFCGALIVAQNVIGFFYVNEYGGAGSNHWVYIDDLMLQYRSNLVMLRWVFPQTIVPWIISLIFIENIKNVKHYVLIITPLLMFGTFSAVFFVYAAFITAVYMLVSSKDKKRTIKNIFSYSNICIFLSMGVVFVLYFWGYIQVEKPASLGFSIGNIDAHKIGVYFIFCIFMFGIYAVCVFKEKKMDILYYIVVSALCIIPLFKMGLYNDWVMCVSICPLFILMVFVVQTLNIKENSYIYGIRSTIIVLTLIMGAWYPMCELRDVVINHKSQSDNYLKEGSLSGYCNRESDSEHIDIIYNYYTYDLDGKTFYEFVARTK